MNYYYADPKNDVVGPFTEPELQELHRRGAITGETNVFKEGDPAWRPFHSMVASQPLIVLPRAVVPTPQVRSVQTSPASKKCPFCAEEIASEAKKCKHCGEFIDVVLRAAEEAKRAAKSQPQQVFMNAASSSAAVASPIVIVANRKSGLLAAVLNLMIPGLGYMYCGRFLLGCFVFVFTVGMIVATSGVAALVLYPMVFIDGFLAAGRANRSYIAIS